MKRLEFEGRRWNNTGSEEEDEGDDEDRKGI